MKEYKPDSPEAQPAPKRPTLVHAQSENQLRRELAKIAGGWAQRFTANPARLEDMLFVILKSHTIVQQVEHEARRRGQPVPPESKVMKSMLSEIIDAGGAYHPNCHHVTRKPKRLSHA